MDQSEQKQGSLLILCCTLRSGSTLLQRLLNTDDGVCICGENNAALLQLLRFYKEILCTENRKTKAEDGSMLSYEQYGERGIKPCWYNHFSVEKIKTHVQKLIRALLYPPESQKVVRYWGCKVVNCCNAELLQYMHVLRELFPDVRVVVHTRNDVEQQAKSLVWRDMDDAVERLTQHNKDMREFAVQNEHFVYRTTYKDIQNVEQLQKLFWWLQLDMNGDAVREQLNCHV